MSRIFLVIMSDGLGMSSGFVAKSAYQCLIYCKVPDDWVEGDIPESSEMWLRGPTLPPDKLERLCEALYGKTWRYGNEDGSRYVVTSIDAFLINPLRVQETPWQHDDPTDKRFQYFHFAADSTGEFKPISPAEL